MNFIAIDTETGGTRPGRHALLSIAAYASWDINPFIVYLWPHEGYVVEAEAAQVNGYSEDLWRQRGAVSLLEGMAQLADWLEAKFKERRKALMLAHNAGFDRMFLAAAWTSWER
jgi:DNA polymerase III epsilon subunit-like protein